MLESYSDRLMHSGWHAQSVLSPLQSGYLTAFRERPVFGKDISVLDRLNRKW